MKGTGGGKKAMAAEEEGEKPPTLTSPIVFQVAVCGGGGGGDGNDATMVWESAPVVSPLQPPQEFNIPFQGKGGPPQSLVLTVSFVGGGGTTSTTLKAVWGNVTLLHQPPWLAPALGLHWREALDTALCPPAVAGEAAAAAADMLSPPLPPMQGGSPQAALVLATLSQLTSLALLHHVALALVAFQGRVKGNGGVGAEEGGVGSSKPFPNLSSPPPPFAPTSHTSSLDAASALATTVLKKDAGTCAALRDAALAHIFTILMVGGVRDGAAAAAAATCATASSATATSCLDGPSGDECEPITSPSLGHLLTLARECQCREPPCPPYLSTAAAAFLHVFLSPQERVGEVERLLGGGDGGYTLELTLLPHHIPPTHAAEDTMVAIQVHALERGVYVRVGGVAGTKTSLVVKVPNEEGVGELLALLPNLGDLFVDFRQGREGVEGVGGAPLATQCIVDPNCRFYATLSKYN